MNAFLPPDTSRHGFDNMADAQMFSPTLMEGYLRAAGQVSALAVGDRERVSHGGHLQDRSRTPSQLEQVEGAPFGTRGGISRRPQLPGRRRLQLPHDAALRAHRPALRQHASSGEQIEVSIDGVRVALLDIDRRMSETDPNGHEPADPAAST